MKEREFLTQKKGRKLKGKIPNKYFEQKPKISPAPNTYSIIKPWADVKEKKSKSFMHKTKNVSKHTYIDQIFDEGKRIKSPGPGSYEPYEHKIIVRLKQKLRY